MNITSFIFLIFIGLGIVAYYLIPSKYRWQLLLLLSFIFVCSSTPFGIFFISFSSLIVYYSALKIKVSDNKKPVLVFAILSVLLLLISFKYIPLGFKDTEKITFIRKYLFPLGISYYSLQIISYLLDVYWERIEPEKNFFKILLFTLYFPQLVQGPISKYSELSRELFKEHEFNIQNIKFGVQLMFYGFFKKMVVADRFANLVNGTFYSGSTPKGLDVWIGLACYGIQLYCDFSGGIDIITGVSECFGIGLKENFRQPYFSLSLDEFWRRWHISLGQWMKDYIFYPFSMSSSMNKFKAFLKKKTNRKFANRVCIAIGDLLVFLIVGLWHGLGTNFIGWGLYNGFILSFSALMTDRYAKWKNKLNINDKSRTWFAFSLVRTLLIVTIGWSFDCSTTLSGALNIFINSLLLSHTSLSVIKGFSKIKLLIMIFSALIVLVVDIAKEKGISVREYMNNKSVIYQIIFWSLLIQYIALFGRTISSGGFMYANF